MSVERIGDGEFGCPLKKKTDAEIGMGPEKMAPEARLLFLYKSLSLIFKNHRQGRASLWCCTIKTFEMQVVSSSRKVPNGVADTRYSTMRLRADDKKKNIYNTV